MPCSTRYREHQIGFLSHWEWLIRKSKLEVFNPSNPYLKQSLQALESWEGNELRRLVWKGKVKHVKKQKVLHRQYLGEGTKKLTLRQWRICFTERDQGQRTGCGRC